MPTLFSTSRAPEALGPYKRAYEAGPFLFLSGQLGLNPETNELEEGIESQTKRACENIKAVLNVRKHKLDQVCKTTIFLADLNDFDIVNKIYGEYFAHKPARSCVEVSKLPKGALVEIEAIATL